MDCLLAGKCLFKGELCKHFPVSYLMDLNRYFPQFKNSISHFELIGLEQVIVFW